MLKIVKWTLIWIGIAILAFLFVLDLSYTPSQKYGAGERCQIIGDHEVVANNCVPYCPPRPSECG